MITIEFRDAATFSLFDLAEYFSAVANVHLARRWNAAVDKNIRLLRDFPKLGTPCFFRHPNLSGLRRLSIEGFPNHLLFYRYFETEGRILIVDIVHGARDLEPLLSTEP